VKQADFIGFVAKHEEEEAEEVAVEDAVKERETDDAMDVTNDAAETRYFGEPHVSSSLSTAIFSALQLRAQGRLVEALG